jgi:hypothetical protein
MSDVNANDLRTIDSIDDVIDTYNGAGADSRTGVEVELAFYNPDTPDLDTMSICQNKALKNAGNAAQGNDFARNEPTAEMLEVGSIAAGPKNLRAVLDNTQANIECLSDKARDMGLKRSYFQHLPEKTANQLLEGLMDVPRYQAFFGPPRRDIAEVAAYFSVCKSNQISVSHSDPAHLLRNIRRLYALAPFLFMVTDNAAPFNEGQSATGHSGMRHRAALGNRGGIPPYLYTAETGEDYIDAHINHVMTNPMFVYYNEEGDIIRLPSGTWESFKGLEKRGLNTATNYFFSESILWPDIKIAALKDKDGNVNGHRFEARMFGVGLHQHQSALLMTAALAFDDAFGEKIDALLGEFGFDLNTPQSLQKPIEASYEAARNHNMKFLDIDYGTGNMADFAKKFADILEPAALMQDFEAELAPILTICRTGWTDSKVNAFMFPTLDSAIAFQRTYDQDIFRNPNKCARTLFEKELKSGKYALAEGCNAV